MHIDEKSGTPIEKDGRDVRWSVAWNKNEELMQSNETMRHQGA